MRTRKELPKGSEFKTDLKTLSERLEREGIVHIYKIHPVAEMGSGVIKLLGYYPTGTHQITIGSGDDRISIIRGYVSFGDFELYGKGFDAERFSKEDDVIRALKNQK